jgi:hypothetical protein
MSAEFSLIGQKGNIRRFGRLAESFDPNAIDADGDGVVQEGTPFKRPAAPNVRLNRGPVATRSRFWDYGKPQITTDALDEVMPDAPDAPAHKPWRDVNISPKRSGSGLTEMNPHVFKINTDKITSSEWDDFKDDVLDHMVPDDDSVEQDKDFKRGIMKLYAVLRSAKVNKNDDGSIDLNMTDYDRARIIKGIKSMHKRGMKVRHMRTIMNLLQEVENDQKSLFFASGENTSRPFIGTRYKSASLVRTVISPDSLIPSLINPNDRADGFRVKGDFPRQSINLKAIGNAISGRTVARSITARFDPNAVDADADGLVQEGTTFQRPGVNKPTALNAVSQMRRLIKPETVERGPMRESIVKPKKPNNVLKVQADRRALDFQLSKLRSTLGRVGNDYVPKWWDNGSEDAFKKNISMESPEVLAEIFGRIYVERRSLMTTKVGRKGDGSLKAYIDSPSAEAKKRNEMLKKRGEAVYREMYGRLLGRQDLPAAERKKQADKFYNWFQLAADNSDWYLNQSFKITKRKSRKKLGIESPVNRRGTRWSEDPNFPSDAFDNVVASIERDLINANPRISRDRARSRAEEIVKAQERRLGRTPNKSPRISGDREIVGNRRLARRVSKFGTSPATKKSRGAWGGVYVASRAQNQIIKRDSDVMIKALDKIKTDNKTKFGKLDSRQSFKDAFKSLSPDIQIDMFSGRKMGDRDIMNKPLTEYDKNILHGYLDVFARSPQILDYPVFINTIDSIEAAKGIGGSHGIHFNTDNPNKPDISHMFTYQSFQQAKDGADINGADYITSLRSGGMLTALPRDTVSNQLIAHYLSKRINSGTSQAQAESVFDDAIAYASMMTALHEGGHAAHSAAIMRDYFGSGIDIASAKQRIQTDLQKLSKDQKRKMIRGIVYDFDKQVFSIEEQRAGQSWGQLDIWRAQGVDIDNIVDELRGGKSLNQQLSDALTANNNQDLIKALTDLDIAFRSDPIFVKNILGGWQHSRWWNRQDRSKRREIDKIEELHARTFFDPLLKSDNLFKLMPMDSNGNFDTKKFFDPNYVLKVPGQNGPEDFTWLDGAIQTSFIRMPHNKYEYDSLTDVEKQTVQPLLEKLSSYAAMTKNYGAAYGNSNVESIAELNASDLSGMLQQMNFSASEMALVNKLLTWLRRPAATPMGQTSGS